MVFLGMHNLLSNHCDCRRFDSTFLAGLNALKVTNAIVTVDRGSVLRFTGLSIWRAQLSDKNVNEDDFTRIRRSWAKAAASGELVGRIFYANLFKLAPQSRAMFPDVIDDQARKLLQTLNWIVDHLDDEETLVPAAQNLAVRHLRYSVLPEHYPAVGEALIETLRQGLGDEFTEADEAAWLRVYTLLSGIMTSAAYEEG